MTDTQEALKVAGWSVMESDPKSVCNWWFAPDHPNAIICQASTEEAAEHIVEALNAFARETPEAETPAVRVKALEWGEASQQPDHITALSMVGEYEIGHAEKSVFFLMLDGVRFVDLGDHYLSAEAAKAAAQADYEARIMAALEPAPVQGWQPIETAPRVELEDIIVFNGVFVQAAQWWEGGWVDSACEWITVQPTHWRRLPPAPQEDA